MLIVVGTWYIILKKTNYMQPLLVYMHISINKILMRSTSPICKIAQILSPNSSRTASLRKALFNSDTLILVWQGCMGRGGGVKFTFLQ